MCFLAWDLFSNCPYFDAGPACLKLLSCSAGSILAESDEITRLGGHAPFPEDAGWCSLRARL